MMRKGEELVNAKGVRDLDPELDEVIGGYCIQDVDLTYAIYNKMCTDSPQILQLKFLHLDFLK
jgi:hypothetical protein